METIRYFHQATVSESLGNGWYTMKKYFLYLLLAVIITGIFEGGFNIFRYDFSNHDFNGFGFGHNWDIAFPLAFMFISFSVIIALAVTFLVAPVISYGADLMFIQAIRDTKPDLKNMFIGFQRNFLNIVLANLLVTIIVVAGIIFLIIPGIIFACRLFMVPYLVMDKQLGAIEAIETSWRMTRGHGFTVFGLGFMSIPIIILGLIVFIIGVFPALVWISASFASLYQAIITENEVETVSEEVE
jgi:uncharacterized membrane protein